MRKLLKKVAGDLRAPKILKMTCGRSEIARYLYLNTRYGESASPTLESFHEPIT
jgi:hypothetical protein